MCKPAAGQTRMALFVWRFKLGVSTDFFSCAVVMNLSQITDGLRLRIDRFVTSLPPKVIQTFI